MAEPRRVPLLPVQSSISNEQLASSQSKDNASGEATGKKADGEKQKTFRLEISLTTSNEKHCPEYSYVDLIKEKQGSDPHFKRESGVGSFDGNGYDDDDELKALAKTFEDKYGPKQDAAKKGKKRKYNSNPYYHDIGYGYDESDPFVDNSEAYDELVPADWTTQHGGFYINQGELHFRPMADSDLKDFKSPKKKRIIDGKQKNKSKASDKSLSKTPKELSTQKRKKQLLSKEKKQKKLESALASQKVKKRKMKRIIEEDSEDAHVLSQVKKQTKLNSSKSLNTNLPKSMSNGTPSQVDGIKSCESSIKTEKLESKVFSPQQGNILSQDSVEHQYDTSNLDNGIVNKKDLIARDLTNELNMTQTTPVGGSAGSSSMTVKTEVTPKDSRKETEAPSSPPNLPENLPLILEAGIQNLKDAAANCQNGKCRFFDASVNKTLLGIARNLVKLPCRVRTTVYDYLAYYLPCSKETLVKRAKTLMIEDQVNQLDAPMNQLREVIEREMPYQKKLYDAEVANALTEQVREQMKQSGLTSKSDDDACQDKTTSSIDEKDNTNTNELASASSEEKVKKNMPKRKFSWTEEIRKLLCDVVAVKVQLYKMLKSRSMTAEEYIKDFLENDVRKLWPKGWMTSRILFKESKSAHQDITQPTNKVKKEKTLKKTEPVQVQRVHSSSNLEQPKLKHNSSMTNLAEARSLTMDSADLQLNTSSKQDTESKSLASNAKPIIRTFVKKSQDTGMEHCDKPGLKKESTGKDVLVKKNEGKSAIIKQDARMVPSSKQQNHPKSFLSSSSKYNDLVSSVTITSPFERTFYTMGSTAQANILNYSKASQQQVAGASKYDVSTAKPVGQDYEKPVHNILDYAAASGDLLGLNPPTVPSSSLSASIASVTETSRNKLPQKSSPLSKGNSPHLQTQFSNQGQPRWISHAHVTEQAVDYLPKSANYGISPKHFFSEVGSSQLIPSKHGTQNPMPKPIFKTPPKDHLSSLPATPPKSSPQNISSHGAASAATSRTSPLLQYANSIEQKRRMSGHSPDDMKHPHGGLSHSISRLTRDASPQQATYTSLPFSSVISSHSSSMAMSKLQGAAQSLEQLHKRSQQQQPLGTPTPMEILFQQQQLHLKKQQLLQQHQQQSVQQQQNVQQQQQQQQQQQHAQQIQGSQGVNMFPDPIDFLAPLQFPGATPTEQYPGPFSNYRPQFI